MCPASNETYLYVVLSRGDIIQTVSWNESIQTNILQQVYSSESMTNDKIKLKIYETIRCLALQYHRKIDLGLKEVDIV